jgi:hypothetical protein
MSARLLAILFALCTPALAVADDVTPTQQAPDGEPLRARLQSLDPKWYDAEHDTWRSVEVQPPKMPDLPDVALPGGGGAVVTAIAWLVAAAVLIALGWLIWQMLPKDGFAALPDEASKPPTHRDARATLLELDAGESDEPESALAAAKRNGNWQRAVVWLYAILLLQLDRAGVVRVRRGATNGRYRLEVAKWTDAGEALRAQTPELLATVDAAIAAFERVYFGQQPADRDLVDALETRIRAALHALPGEVDR